MKKLLLSLFFVFLPCSASEPIKVIERKTKLGPVIFSVYDIKTAPDIDKVPFEQPITNDDTHYIKAKQKETGAILAHCKATKARKGNGIFTSDHVLGILSPHLRVIAASLKAEGQQVERKKPPTCTLL